MRIIETDPKQLHFEGRTVSQQGWLLWAGSFLPGMAALLLLPESYRFAGFLIWIVIWLASIGAVPRWLGELVRVTIDSPARQIIWTRDGRVTRTVPFSDIKQFGVAPLTTASRPYKTFQLFAILRNGGRVTLAVDPKEAEIQRALRLTRERFPK